MHMLRYDTILDILKINHIARRLTFPTSSKHKIAAINDLNHIIYICSISNISLRIIRTLNYKHCFVSKGGRR